MQYRALGCAGVQVSSLVLRTMNVGKLGRTAQDEVTAIVDDALTAGINLIDTADGYSGGQSEEIVGNGHRRFAARCVTSPIIRAARSAGSSPNWATACAASTLTTSTAR